MAKKIYCTCFHLHMHTSICIPDGMQDIRSCRRPWLLTGFQPLPYGLNKASDTNWWFTSVNKWLNYFLSVTTGLSLIRTNERDEAPSNQRPIPKFAATAAVSSVQQPHQPSIRTLRVAMSKHATLVFSRHGESERLGPTEMDGFKRIKWRFSLA